MATKPFKLELRENTIIIVFGASDDLAKKKIFPALFGLYRAGFHPNGVKIVGYARTKMGDAEFHKRVTSYIKDPDQSEIEEFEKQCTYVSGGYGDAASFENLEKHLKGIESAYKSEECNRVFYLALPPSVFLPVAKNVKTYNYAKTGVNRIIVEKPFGKDLDSSRELLSSFKEHWTEDETYRIDHFLGKEIVQNLLVLRFSNILFSTAWDRNSISNVQITFKEPFGTEGRGGYFAEFGIIRDVMQNHLLQVLSILAMERPASFASEDVRDEKVKVLRAIPPIRKEDTLLGQYVSGNGKPGYLDDDTVPRGSTCPTFAATTLWINITRWEGVPFILKAGKALDEAKVEVLIQFKDITQGIFKDAPRNELVLRIDPSEGVYVHMNSKVPRLLERILITEMDLTYKRRFSDNMLPEVYEVLILEALKGDHSNFVRDDEIDVAWKIFTPILEWIEGKESSKPLPSLYSYGSRGPTELDQFTSKYGVKWMWPDTDLASL